MNIKTPLLLLSFTLISACGGSGSDDTNEKNTQSASQTNPVKISPFKKLQGVWMDKEDTYYSFDDKGNYKMLSYSKSSGCNLLLDSYNVNNSGNIDFKKLNSNISNVDITDNIVTVTTTIKGKSETTRLYKTQKIEQELGSVCQLKDTTGTYASMQDITGTWRRTVYKNGDSYQLYMHINNNFHQLYATSNELSCYVKGKDRLRFHEIGYGVFSIDNGGSIVIAKGANSITIQNEVEKSSSDTTWTKSYQDARNFNICKE